MLDATTSEDHLEISQVVCFLVLFWWGFFVVAGMAGLMPQLWKELVTVVSCLMVGPT